MAFGTYYTATETVALPGLEFAEDAVDEGFAPVD